MSSLTPNEEPWSDPSDPLLRETRLLPVLSYPWRSSALNRHRLTLVLLHNPALFLTRLAYSGEEDENFEAATFADQITFRLHRRSGSGLDIDSLAGHLLIAFIGHPHFSRMNCPNCSS